MKKLYKEEGFWK